MSAPYVRMPDAVPIEPAHVREQGEGALEAVPVGFDHSRHEDVVTEPLVDAMGAPGGALLLRAGGQDPALSYGDRPDGGLPGSTVTTRRAG